MSLLVFAATTALAVALAPGADAASTTITIDTGSIVGPVDRRILGANQVWPLGMAGALDLTTGAVDPTFDVAMREAALTTLRYPGGTVANLFRWERAIGPQNQRLGQTSTTTVPFDSIFGPDEYGQLLDAYGLIGNIVVNIGTGTAKEAADWVEYMTARVGEDRNGLATRRAQNGHPQPYDIPYWEVGNEIIAPAQRYWMAGDPTAADVARGCTTFDCRYTHGGFGHFNNQGVGTFNDFTAPRSLSDGTAAQSFYVQYPPIVPGTATVSVAGQAWQEVVNLTGQGKAYTLDTASGIIRFGNGINGQIPPPGARITATYDSGPHDGFVAFYKAMKYANPNIKVCSSVFTTFFIENAPEYDCIVSHIYVGGPASPGPSESLPVNEYHPALMLLANSARDRVTTLQQQIAPFKPNAEVIVTEYGHLGSGGPSDFPQRFHLTLSEALFTANAILRWAEIGLPYAQRHRLVDWVFTPLPLGAANVGAPDNSMIAGPTPFVAQPQAKVLGLFSRTMGTQRLAANIANNPTETGSWGALPGLEVLPTKFEDGSVGVIVINQSGINDVTATVLPQGMVHRRAVGVLTVNGPSLTAYNTYDSPDTVALRPSTIDAGNLSFDYTFPAHSVTGFRLVTATPFDLINEQVGLVGSISGGSFASQLEHARASLASGDTKASCNQLNAYANHVQAQSGKAFSSAQAASLLTNVKLIESVIGC